MAREAESRARMSGGGEAERGGRWITSSAGGSGGRLVTADGRTLPLRAVSIQGEAGSGLARVALEQRFVNAYGESLRVTYLMPLPTEGTLAGYAVRVGGRRIVGEVDRIVAARERFENAWIEGRTAGLVEQDRPDLFTLEIGNIPPGAEVIAELEIDQQLTWRPEGEWEWRFPTVVAPRYQGADGRVLDAGRVTVDVSESGMPARATATLVVRDELAQGRQPESPSHGVRVRPGPSGLEAVLLNQAAPASGKGNGAARPGSGAALGGGPVRARCQPPDWPADRGPSAC